MEQKKIEYFYHQGYCPVRDIISRLGDKWTILVLTTLSVNQKLRFSQIRDTIGDISQRMLTVTLRSLESDGLVSRQIYPEVPPRVEYELTELGSQLFNQLSPLITWAKENMNTIIENRSNFKQKS